MDVALAQVSVAGSRLKVLSCAIVTIVGFLMVAATGFLMYEKIQEKLPKPAEQTMPTNAQPLPLTGQVPTSFNGVQTLEVTERTTTLDTSTSCGLLSTSANSSEDLSKDCSIFKVGTCQSGSYVMCPYGEKNDSVPDYCERTEDGIWTVIQKRIDGSVDFYRNWSDYKNGFGDVSGEHWLGNDIIHQPTSQNNYMLKIVLTYWDNVTEFALYNTFRIADEGDGYRLVLGTYNNTGYAGDALSHHNGFQFSTPDRDNDDTSLNCAQMYSGVWWYHSCYNSNLNGHYYSGPIGDMGLCLKGIVWESFYTSNCLKATTMMIKKI